MVTQAQPLSKGKIHAAAVDGLLADVHLAEVLEKTDNCKLKALPRLRRSTAMTWPLRQAQQLRVENVQGTE